MPLGLQEVEAPRISREAAHEGGKLLALRNGRLFLPGDNPGTSFCWRLSRPQGHSAVGKNNSKKMPVTTSGTEPANL
jgi:hypothetical protein